MADVEPAVRDRAGGLVQLDEQLHCRAGDAGHAERDHLRHVHHLRVADVWRGRVHLVLCPRDQPLDVGGDGCVVRG